MTTTAIIMIAAIAATLTGGLAFIVGYAFGVRSEHKPSGLYGGLKM